MICLWSSYHSWRFLTIWITPHIDCIVHPELESNGNVFRTKSSRHHYQTRGYFQFMAIQIQIKIGRERIQVAIFKYLIALKANTYVSLAVSVGLIREADT